MTENVRDFSKHWNEMSAKRNLPGIVALYTIDTWWLSPNDARSVGTNKVKETYERLFQAQNMSLVHTTENITVSESGDMAAEIGAYELSRTLRRESSKIKANTFFC